MTEYGFSTTRLSSSTKRTCRIRCETCRPSVKTILTIHNPRKIIEDHIRAVCRIDNTVAIVRYGPTASLYRAAKITNVNRTVERSVRDHVWGVCCETIFRVGFTGAKYTWYSMYQATVMGLYPPSDDRTMIVESLESRSRVLRRSVCMKIGRFSEPKIPCDWEPMARVCRATRPRSQFVLTCLKYNGPSGHDEQRRRGCR